ncbi:37S ribosomal protein MRP4, mitochondrial [Sphaceloma murrayae]|uniref:37S ribosomal protein MRP4, mitochondrial n=1 Tax=Sphaceloma murrayae TaxID=2082308 RepID=A0A2K1QPK3_9PEZI|nr:37S ribosomal protein MRP4, mitochondrial [Sphaceloma murrayae]
MDYTARSNPESHAAKSFGDDLDSVFGMDKPLAELSQKVEEKKRVVDSQTEELAAIENRLKEAEARLAQVTGTKDLPPAPVTKLPATNHSSAPPAGANVQHGTEGPRPQAPPKDSTANFSRLQPVQDRQSVARALEQAERKPLNPRQDSLGLPPMPGAMPVTPSGMEYRGNEYMTGGQR